jgi:predicted nucleic acid-binding protein
VTVCIDASVIVRCLTLEQGGTEILSWLISKADEEIVAPTFLPMEFGTALRRKMARGEMTEPQCVEALELYCKLGIRYVWDDRIVGRAFELAVALNQPTLYDSAYLAVAEQEDCELWTLDRRFAEAASSFSRYVRVLR